MALANLAGIRIIALVHSYTHAIQVFEDYLCNNNFCIIEWDITCNIESLECEDSIDYIIHAAGVSKKSICLERPTEALHINYMGTRNMLELALTHKIKAFLFISSAAVYGSMNEDMPGFNSRYQEDMVGIVDFKNPKNVYALSKRVAETTCYSYYYEKNVPIIVVRPFHLYGPGIENERHNIIGKLINDVIKNNDIVLNSGASIRNFSYVTDVVKCILMVLFKGNIGETYNIGNSGGGILLFMKYFG